MQFNYAASAGEATMHLDVKEYSHIFKVRRVSVNQTLDWSNLNDEKLYTYKIQSISKKEATLELIETKEIKNISTCQLHVGWCIVDPKTVEKHIAMLNEIGVLKISFVYSEFSQKNYKIDKKRIQRILINSSEQCGRVSMMQIEIITNVEEYFNLYPNSVVIDFCENYIKDEDAITNFLVGPEGGFSKSEKLLFKNKKVYGLKAPNILKSETAVVGISAKLGM